MSPETKATDHPEPEKPLEQRGRSSRVLFDFAPAPLWEADVSLLCAYFDRLRAAGVSDLRAHLADHEGDLAQCVQMIRVVSVNRATLELYEAPDEASLSADLGAVFTEESRAAFREIVIALFEGRRRFAIETVNRTLGGKTLQVKLTWSLLEEGALPPVRALVAVEDITERKKAREESAARESLLRQIMDTSGVGIGLVDLNGRFLHANRSMAAMFGFTLDEFLGSAYADHVHPGERAGARQSLQALLTGEVPSVDLVRRYQRKDGTAFWGHLTCNRFHDAGGVNRGVIGVITDITERKQAEQKLQESETRLNTILDNVGAAIFIKDRQYRYTYVNRKVSEVFSRRAEEILGKTDDAFFSGASVDEIMRSDRPVIEQGETIAREEAGLIAADGTSRTYWTVKLPLRDGAGAITGLCGISTDITARKAAEAALQKSERMLQTIIDAEPECVKLLDENANLVMMNRAGLAMCNLLGNLRI